MLKVSAVLSLVVLSISIALGGCATTQKEMTFVDYIDIPSKVHLDGPIYVKVIDNRPEAERNSKEWSTRYISTEDGTDKERVAFVLAEGVATVLLRKKVVDQAFVLGNAETAPQGSTILEVKLLSWYGRVTDLSKLTHTEKGMVTALGYKAPAYDNQGECRFSAVVRRPSQSVDLGVSYGEASAYLKNGGTMQEANQLSAVAENKALFAFLQTFEKQLGK